MNEFENKFHELNVRLEKLYSNKTKKAIKNGF